MTEMRRFGLGDAIVLLVVLAIAAGARIGYLIGYCDHGAADGPFQVQDDWKQERESLVTNLRQGQGFMSRAPLAAKEEITAHTAIGYPWLVSLVDGGWMNLPAEQLVRWLQCALGILTAGLYFAFARRAFHSLLVGALAGIFCALHPFWILNTAEINDGTLATFLVGLSLFLGVRGSQSGGPLTSLLFGLGLAGLACVRAPLVPFAFAALLGFLARCRDLPRGWLCAVLAFLGFFNGLIPWTVRNYQSFHTIVPIVDSTFLHLWMGNNSRATGGPETDETMRQALADGGRVSADQLEKEPQPARYHRLGSEVLNEIQDNPTPTVQRRLRAGLGFFFGINWLEGGSLAREEGPPPEGPDWVYRSAPGVLAGSLLGMLLLGALGWRWTYGWRHFSVPSSLAVIWIPLPYLLSHAELLHGPRLPLDGVLLSYAAFAIACMVPGVSQGLLRGGEVEAGN